MGKLVCLECNKIATWFYMPSSKNFVYCDEHVPRGCSCNLDEHGHETLDEKGRRDPCCEFHYDKDGWDEEVI